MFGPARIVAKQTVKILYTYNREKYIIAAVNAC